MLFMVPDTETDSSPSSGDPQETTAASSSDGSGRTNGDASPPVVNVELDLDDAPFLDEPEPEPEPEQDTKQAENTETAVAMPDQDHKPSLKERLLQNKKKLILAGAAFFVLVLATVLVNVFLFGGDEDAPPPPPAETPVDPVRRVVVPSTPPDLPAGPEAPKFIIELDPFWVPTRGPEGEILFFVFTCNIPTDDPALNAEIGAKTVALRDAVFYYLKNKQSLADLVGKGGAEALHQDIINVLNENLTGGKVSKIYVMDFHTEGS